MDNSHADENQTSELLSTPWRDGVALKWGKEEVAEQMRHILKKHEAIDKLLTKDERERGLTVFLTGPDGHGKSSTINGLFAAIENEYKELAIVRYQNNYGTLEFRKHRPKMPRVTANGDIRVEEDELVSELFNISYADFIGIDQEKYSIDAKAALFGLLCQGRKAESIQKETVEALKQIEASGFIERTTASICVIWVVDIKSSEEDLGYMPELMREASKYDIPQFLALTKCDDLDENFCIEPRRMYFSSALEKKVAEAAAIVGIPLYRTFPIKNLTIEMVIKPELAYQYLYMLQYVLEDTEEKLLQLRKTDRNT